MRAEQPGWNLIAMHDPADRRGVWMRHNAGEQTTEICAGREGDDDYIKFSIGEKITPQQIVALNSIMQTAMWAIDLAIDAGQVISKRWQLHPFQRGN